MKRLSSDPHPAERDPLAIGVPRHSLTSRASIVSCERCIRLRTYCQRVALEKKRAHRLDTYWGKPVPGFGDPDARVLLVGLAPAAHGANRYWPRVHG